MRRLWYASHKPPPLIAAMTPAMAASQGRALEPPSEGAPPVAGSCALGVGAVVGAAVAVGVGVGVGPAAAAITLSWPAQMNLSFTAPSHVGLLRASLYTLAFRFVKYAPLVVASCDRGRKRGSPLDRRKGDALARW